MKRFLYLCGDRGIPLPGSKGASIHVEQVCRAFARHGLDGDVRSCKVDGDELAGLPLRPLGGLGDDYSERPDFVYERYSLWHLDGLERARRWGVPFVLEVNSPLPDEARRHRGLDDADRAYDVARRLMQSADGIVAVSEEVAGWVRKLRGRDDGVWVVPNGVDPERFAARTGRHPGLATVSAPVIAFCGSFRPWHGMSDLHDAFVQLALEDHRHLLCVGDGPERASFEEGLRSAGLLDDATFTGRIAQAEVPDWLGSADVAVVPYPADGDFYFSPLKLFEYMALGLPVVAADIGQIPQILDHGKRGLLYRAGDPGALADAIRALLDDPFAARGFALRARTWVLERATWERRTADILDRVADLPVRLDRWTVGR